MSNKLALVKTGDTTYDKIFAHFIDEAKYPLTDTQKKIKIRWLSAWTLRTNGNFNSTDQAVNIYMKKFGVSRAQSFRDIRNAEKLFGKISKSNKDGKRAIWSEYVHQYLQLAKKEKDLKSVGKALDQLERAWELDRTEAQGFNPKKLEDREVKLSISKNTISIFEKMLSKGIIDLNNPPIDVEHEELD